MRKLVLKSKSVTRKTRIVQISDTHIIVPDKKDGKLYKIEKERKLFFEREALNRTGEVRYAEEELEEAIEYAKGVDLTVFTGDMVEFATQTNVDKLAEYFKKSGNFLYTFGNHDYLHCYLWAENPQNQREQNGEMFRKIVDNDIEFAVKNVNGVNIVTMDNSLLQFSERQYIELKKTLEENCDAILFMHVPLYHPSLDKISFREVGLITETCGGNDNLDSAFYPTESTRKVIELIREKHEKVLAIMAGHNHYAAKIKYYENIIECVCPPAYLHDFYEIEIVK